MRFVLMLICFLNAKIQQIYLTPNFICLFSIITRIMPVLVGSFFRARAYVCAPVLVSAGAHPPDFCCSRACARASLFRQLASRLPSSRFRMDPLLSHTRARVHPRVDFQPLRASGRGFSETVSRVYTRAQVRPTAIFNKLPHNFQRGFLKIGTKKPTGFLPMGIIFKQAFSYPRRFSSIAYLNSSSEITYLKNSSFVLKK